MRARRVRLELGRLRTRRVVALVFGRWAALFVAIFVVLSQRNRRGDDGADTYG
jgi:hypothetical protein